MASRDLWVVFCSDTEDNHPNYLPGWSKLGSNYDRNPAIIRWDWTQFWPSIQNCFTDASVPVTWLFRVDEGPIYDGMLTRFKSDILELLTRGDEVGIHIHTLVWDPICSKWMQTRDPNYEEAVVRSSIGYFRRVLGQNPRSVRMGWNTMSNKIMITLEESGIIVDASAIPGNYCSGKFSRRDNFYDWRGTPRYPYHPSAKDYRLPGQMSILEMPIRTLPTIKNIGRLINGLSNHKVASVILSKFLPAARKLTNINPNNYFYISPYWSSSIPKKIMHDSIDELQDDVPMCLTCFFHAADILNPKTGKENSLFKENIRSLISAIQALNGVTVKFLTLADAAMKLRKFSLV